MKYVAFDFRWVGESLRGIALVSICHLSRISPKYSGVIIITARGMEATVKKHLIEFNIKRSYHIVEVNKYTSDFFELNKVLCKFYKDEVIDYYAMGNFAAKVDKRKIRQYLLLHDFAWSFNFINTILGNKLNKLKILIDKYSFAVNFNHLLFLNYVDTILYVSDYVYSHSFGKYLKIQSTLLPNKLCKDFYLQKEKNNLGLEKNLSSTKKLLWIGGKKFIKNYKFFMKALKIVRRAGHVFDVVLVGVEKDSLTYNNHLIDDYVKTYPIMSHRELVKEIFSCDVLVVPSFTESFSIPAFIALCAGKKIVITKNSPYSSHENIKIIDPESPLDIASGVSHFLCSKVYDKKS